MSGARDEASSLPWVDVDGGGDAIGVRIDEVEKRRALAAGSPDRDFAVRAERRYAATPFGDHCGLACREGIERSEKHAARWCRRRGFVRRTGRPKVLTRENALDDGPEAAEAEHVSQRGFAEVTRVLVEEVPDGSGLDDPLDCRRLDVE